MPDYELVPANQIYRGYSYGDLVGLWSNWIVSKYPDKANRGIPVYFLRGVDFPNKTGDSQGVAYTERAVLMTGHDKLRIPEGSAIFFGVLNAIIDSVDNPVADDTLSRLSAADQDLVRGDNPPDPTQITIDGEPIKDEEEQTIRVEDFLVYSPEFTLHVPDVPYGISLAPFFDIPFKHPGARPAITAGWFFLVKLNKGTHIIHTFGKGPPVEQGIYRTEKLYEIEVVSSQEEAIGLIPSAYTSDLLARIKDKHDKQEIDQETYERLQNITDQSRNVLKSRILGQFEMQRAIQDKMQRAIQAEIKKTEQTAKDVRQADKHGQAAAKEKLKQRPDEMQRAIQRVVDKVREALK